MDLRFLPKLLLAWNESKTEQAFEAFGANYGYVDSWQSNHTAASGWVKLSRALSVGTRIPFSSLTMMPVNESFQDRVVFFIF